MKGRDYKIPELNRRISELISATRRYLESDKSLGSRGWWTRIDKLSQRKYTKPLSLDNEYLDSLNDYFGQLCHDVNYTEPSPLRINTDAETPPGLSDRQVLNALSNIKRTTTGPDGVPYWIWKDFSDVLTPVVKEVWNLCLRTAVWPDLWKQANLKPLPKIDVPSDYSDFRGINVTPVIARAFERVVLKSYSQKVFDDNLNVTQFAYRRGGDCTCALLKIQYNSLKVLDNANCKAVRVFAMDFSKAFDSVKHNLLVGKLKSLPLNPYIINLYISFLRDRKQRVVYNNKICEWKAVNQGTTQGSVSGPHLFNLFLDDLYIQVEGNATLEKYADDSTLQVAVYKNSQERSPEFVSQFMEWSSLNKMNCNISKCKELTFRKKSNNDIYPVIDNMEQHEYLKILGITFQSNCRYSKHVKNILYAANKSLYVIRSLRKEGLTQHEVDLLFRALVLSRLTYGISVYGASVPELSTIQAFLTRCFKRRHISEKLDISALMEKSDRTIFRKACNPKHPLHTLLPVVKGSSKNLRRQSSLWPRVILKKKSEIHLSSGKVSLLFSSSNF